MASFFPLPLRITVVLITTVSPITPIQAQAPNFAAAAKRTERMKKKLETIIIPHVDFREQTLPETIGFLRKKSVELDVEEPDPARRGVSIGIMKPGSAGAPGLLPNGQPARITVSLSNIPLLEALRYVAGLSNSAVRVKSGVVTFVPESLPLEIITREWKITPAIGELIPRPYLKPGADLAKTWFICSDDRVPGPTLVVSRDGKRIIGKGTEEELALFDRLLSRSPSEGR